MVAILQTLLELAGVNAALVLDGSGRVLAFKGHAIYDGPLLEQVSLSVVKALDSIRLRHDDWDSITVQYEDGKLLLRNLGTGGLTRVLALVADGNLNPSFATVAMRVAVAKLKKELDSTPMLGHAAQSGPTASASASASASPSPSPSPPLGPSSRPTPVRAAAPRDTAGYGSGPVLATSGLSWSGLGASGSSTVGVADQATSAYLSRVNKELARYVGPMSKVYIKEAIRRVSPGAPFGLSLGAQLVAELCHHIDDPADRQRFTRAVDRA